VTDTNFKRQLDQWVGRRRAAENDGRAAARPYLAEEQSVFTENGFGVLAPLPPAIAASRRLVREWKTMAAMVRCYCQGRHGAVMELCPDCQGLLDYATLRLDRCHFGAEKPTCANCPVHCYQRDRREQMKAVMRHAGPRMLWRHPVLSFRHWLDGFCEAPPSHEDRTSFLAEAAGERLRTKP